MLEPERGAAGDRELVEQRLGQAVVVVTWDEDRFAAPQRLAELLEERTCRGERLAERPLAQLNRVAEEDYPVGGRDLLQQRASDRRVADDVFPGGAAEVQVGDDRSAHPPLLPVGGTLDSGMGRLQRHGPFRELLARQPVVARLPGVHVFGEEKLALANGIELAYQEIGEADGEPLLLVMGLATQMLLWDERLCALLAERGFRVVRFDNRDIGRSTMFDRPGRRGGWTRSSGGAGRSLPPDRHGRRRDGADGPPGDRDGPHGRRLHGRDDRPDAGDPSPERVRSMVSIMSTTGNRCVGSRHGGRSAC